MPGHGNPNHPVVKEMDRQWHKIAALLLMESGKREFEVTSEILTRLAKSDLSIVADTRGGKLVIRLVTAAEGERLARKEGGLPV